MCLYPKLIKNPKYRANKKNGGVIPPVPDERVKEVPIGCGNCMECRKQKARHWQVRLLEDLREHKNGKFIALTFSDESIAKLCETIEEKSKGSRPEGYVLDNAIATLATRLFLERWRKKYKKSLRHWLVTELGHEGTENIHLHGIVWTDEDLEEVERVWQYGFVWKGKPKWKQGKIIGYKQYVNEQTVNYTIKYVHKQDEQHKLYKSIILTSPGIGRGYTKRMDANRNTYNGDETNETYRTRNGYKIALPIYYRNKIYTEEQREQLWLQKLDKEERWVCGEKVNISTIEGLNQYFKLLEYHRGRNAQLGYGTDEKDWNREVYEREIRKIKQETRIQRAKASPAGSIQKG